ncbi:MFS transporter [Micromonospora sonneratiae]|uniref:MFS transporter n=1 Tax=Micromonospora sonneratiae TaxID=1184706 RepID=A0ABW3Y6W4_9ACTN
MRRLVSQVRSFDRPMHLLLLNQFGINLGFYMLMPYLANHLSIHLLLASWLVGLILGVRNLSQQGMFAVGGALADRFGDKPLILAGCALRTVGFALLGLVDSVPVLIVGAAATGLAGALFNPAVRAYVAAEAGDRRVEAFALFNVFYQAGILVGPVVGLALTTLDFRLTCLVAAAVFAFLTVLQARALPVRGRPATADRGVLGDLLRSWRQVTTNRAFMLFTGAMAGSYVLSFQVYLALPLAIEAAAGTEKTRTVAVAIMFAVSGLLSVLGQLKVTEWCRRRWSQHDALLRGVALMGAAFLPMAVAGLGPDPVVVVAAVLSGALIAVATMVAYPFEMATVVALAGGGRIATHYGVYHTVSGITIALGNLLAGAALDLAHEVRLPAVPWLAFAALGTGCALMIHQLRRRGLLDPAPPGQPAVPSTV